MVRKVIVADIQDELGRSVCHEIGPEETIFYVHCNVTCDSDMQNAVNIPVSKYGKLDIMFSNAGISGGLETRILHSDDATLKRVLDVNVYGAFLARKHAARVMIPAKSGCIIFTCIHGIETCCCWTFQQLVYGVGIIWDKS